MRVLVVFHIHYLDNVGYYLQKMENILSCEWDLIVTSDASLEAELKKRILEVKGATRFLHTDNVGYDIWPFIAAIKSVNLDGYDFVIKLHTKNEDDYSIKLNGIRMDGRAWKEYMVEPMLGSKERFRKLMEIFRMRPSIGLAYARQLGFISKGVNVEDGAMLDTECSRLGIVPSHSGKHFCAGTMMAIRASALTFLQGEKITADTFELSASSHTGATMAHVYERLIPIAVQASGYSYFPLYENIGRAIHFKVKDVATPLLEWVFSVNNFEGKGTKAITVFGHRFLKKI